MTKIHIETERLILRDFRMTDDNHMFELDSDPDVHKYLGNKPALTIDESRNLLHYIQQQYKENGIGRWAIIEKSTGEFVGWTGLKLIKEMTNNHIDFYDVGYRLMKKHWNKGYATETAKASLKYGFEELNLDVIYGITHMENLKSRRALEKSGLTFIERFIWHGWNDLPCDWLKITREEWKKLNVSNGDDTKI